MIIQTIDLLDHLIDAKKSRLSVLKSLDKCALADQKNLYRQQLLLYREIDELNKQRQFLLDIDSVDALQLTAERIYRRTSQRMLVGRAQVYDLALVELFKKIAMLHTLKQAMVHQHEQAPENFVNYAISK